MNIYQNYSLKPHNTFGIEAKAEYYVIVHSNDELVSVYTSAPYKDMPKRILGGGSNVLITSNINEMVVQPAIQGIEILEENEHEVYIGSGAGENWDTFVEYCVKRNYGGIENLSLIPGNVGSSPIQNIGAYGVEVRDCLEWVEYFDIERSSFSTIDNEACHFDYRNSIFKNELKDKVVITRVCFRLQKKPVLNIHYGTIKDELDGVSPVQISDVRQAVIKIRSAKLPDPQFTGNAGSFFKNPVVPVQDYRKLKNVYPDIPGYTVDPGNMKIPAAWLIQECHWKGYTEGNVGVHHNQPLVLINKGNASGLEILNLAQRIADSVAEKFNISLEKEVNIW